MTNEYFRGWHDALKEVKPHLIYNGALGFVAGVVVGVLIGIGL